MNTTKSGLLADLLDGGYSIAAAAQQVGVSLPAAYRYASKHGLPYNRTITPGIRRRINRLAVDGNLSADEIGKLTRQSVARVAEALAKEPRPDAGPDPESRPQPEPGADAGV